MTQNNSSINRKIFLIKIFGDGRFFCKIECKDNQSHRSTMIMGLMCIDKYKHICTIKKNLI